MNAFSRKMSKCCARLSLPHFCIANSFLIYVFNYRKEKNIQTTKSKAACYKEAECFFASRVNVDANVDVGSSDGESSDGECSAGSSDEESSDLEC